jgi:hypothetical protein
MILLALAAAVAAAQPAELHTYKDWVVGCDNVRVCQANALERDADDDDYLELTIKRGARPGDRATLFVPLADSDQGERLSLKVDGVDVVTFTARAKVGASLPLTGALLAALRNGAHVMVFDDDGKKLGGTSLAGLAAALRYIDDQQGRVGAVGALRATGARPDAETPAPPAYPVIVMPAPSAKPPRTLSVATATRLIGPDNATCDYANGKVKPRAYRLDAAHSLVLIDIPCGNGAYNYFTSVYVLGETGEARPARFDLPPTMSAPSTDGSGQLTNGDWDPKTRRLGSFEKGRGLGDCGATETYAWDGARFRLVERDEMGECRGSTDFIRTWIARVSG